MFKSAEEIDAIRRRCNEVENNLIGGFLGGRIARRELLRHGAVLGISAPLVAGLAACTDATSYPLDLVSGAIAGYGLRKLRNAYAGKAVNIRRSSDNAAQDIGFAGNDFDVAAFTAFVGAGTGFVTKWYDQVGSQDASQATAAQQPTVVLAATPSGRAALQSTGAPVILVGTLAVAQTVPLTLASTVNASGGNYMLYFNLQGGPPGNAGPGLLLSNSNGLGVGGQYGTFITLPGPYNGTWHSTVGVMAAGNTGTAYVDGTSAAGTVSTTTGATNIYIMSDAGGLALTGYLAEGIYFGRALSGTDITTIRASHQSYYGTP